MNKRGARCCVSSCRNYGGGNIRLHKFPALRSKKELFKKWKEVLSNHLRAGCRSDEEMSRKLFVCSAHFEVPNDGYSYGKRGLKWDAVPSLNLGEIPSTPNNASQNDLHGKKYF